MWGVDHQDRRRRRTPFLRDVGVNIAANTASAPVIYLLAVAVGSFPTPDKPW
ncbi:MAG: hypothetical protein QOH97_1617 [Actinoplanes sp.]|jgi:hypothetical protein|nr:hypothetical protein [Actinoplanes sp.]